MCGRFGLFHTWQDMLEAYGLIGPALNLPPRWNIAPTQDVVTVIRGAVDSPGGPGTRRGNAAAMCRWGLVPSWAKDIDIGAKMINARAETAAEKPAFRAAMRRRRCLIPVSGFYEWQANPAGKGPKQPYWIARADGGLMSFAGLWEIWTAPDGSELRTCSILTTDASEALAPVHHRMPVMLEAGEFEAWLGTGADENAELRAAQDLLTDRAARMPEMELRPVAREVNAVRNDGPELIAPVDPAAKPAPAPARPAGPRAPKAQGELF